MDFDQMRAVVEVARLRSFSRAAETLGLTQPAISAQVRVIEEETGYRLFDRLGRSVHLTQPGPVLLDSPFILPEMGHTRAALDQMLLPYRRRLKVAFESSGIELIKRLVAAGMGVTIIGETYAAEQARAGTLKLLPLRGVRQGRDIG